MLITRWPWRISKATSSPISGCSSLTRLPRSRSSWLRRGRSAWSAGSCVPPPNSEQSAGVACAADPHRRVALLGTARTAQTFGAPRGRKANEAAAERYDLGRRHDRQADGLREVTVHRAQVTGELPEPDGVGGARSRPGQRRGREGGQRDRACPANGSAHVGAGSAAAGAGPRLLTRSLVAQARKVAATCERTAVSRNAIVPYRVAVTQEMLNRTPLVAGADVADLGTDPRDHTHRLVAEDVALVQGRPQRCTGAGRSRRWRWP